jgi:hypothetical protein
MIMPPTLANEPPCAKSVALLWNARAGKLKVPLVQGRKEALDSTLPEARK